LTAEVLAPPDTSERPSDGEFTDGLFARLMAAAALIALRMGNTRQRAPLVMVDADLTTPPEVVSAVG